MVMDNIHDIAFVIRGQTKEGAGGDVGTRMLHLFHRMFAAGPGQGLLAAWSDGMRPGFAAELVNRSVHPVGAEQQRIAAYLPAQSAAQVAIQHQNLVRVAFLGALVLWGKGLPQTTVRRGLLGKALSGGIQQVLADVLEHWRQILA